MRIRLTTYIQYQPSLTLLSRTLTHLTKSNHQDECHRATLRSDEDHSHTRCYQNCPIILLRLHSQNPHKHISYALAYADTLLALLTKVCTIIVQLYSIDRLRYGSIADRSKLTCSQIKAEWFDRSSICGYHSFCHLDYSIRI